MSRSVISACIVPAAVWTETRPATPSLARLADVALDCERRVMKHLDTANQEMRHFLACQRLERRVLADPRVVVIDAIDQLEHVFQDGGIARVDYPDGFLTLIEGLARDAGCPRGDASVHPPGQVHALAEWMSAQSEAGEEPAASLRKRVFVWAARNGCAVVEPREWHSGPAVRTTAAGLPADEEPVSSRGSFLPPVAWLEQIESRIASIPNLSGGQKEQASELLGEITTALQDGASVMLGGKAKHEVITEVLNAIVFQDGIAPASVRLAYVDGSEAQPFPIAESPRAKLADASDSRLSAALMSIRHQDMDRLVDFCWFRNSEVSTRGAMAERDEFCTRYTREQVLRAAARGEFSMNLFHTGYEPAVVGFYRGVVLAAREIRARGADVPITVVPKYFRGEEIVQGSPWVFGGRR